MTEADVLRQAKALIAEEAKFCQMSFARNREGDHTQPCAEDACQWCVVGAILHVSEQDEYIFFNDSATRAIEALARVIGYDSVWTDIEAMVETIAGENDRSGMKDRRPDLAFKRMHKILDAAIKESEARIAA